MQLHQLSVDRILKSFDKRYSAFIQRRFWRIAAEETPMGFRFSGNESMQDGSFEPQETRLLGMLMAHTNHFVNVGANIGYYCCLAIQRGLPVIAFEPEQNNLKFLLRNIRENGWSDRIEVFPLAVADRPGIVDIYGSGTGASLLKGWADTPDHLVASIPATTMDLCIGQRLKGRHPLILIDIEGAEFLALQGAHSTLRSDPKPIWMIEICSHQHQPAGVAINPYLLQTFDLFWNNNYAAYTAEDTPRQVNRAEVLAISQGGPDTLGLHNFIFIDPNLVSAVLPPNRH